MSHGRSSRSSGRMTPESQNGNGEGSSVGGGGGRRQQDWAQINDWEVHRERITELYRDQGLHLKQVQEIMADQYNFHASQRMYKTRISKWAIDKNLKAADVATILRMQQMRAALGKKSKFTIRGREIDFARVEQYLKRDPTLLKQSQNGKNNADDMLPGHMEAAGITCRTPSPTPPPSPSPPSGQHGASHHHHHHHLHPQDHFHHHAHEPHAQPPHDQHHHHAHAHAHHQHHPFSSQPYGHSVVPIPPATVPIVPSHAPMPMVTTAASFPGMSAGLSSAPFTTLPSPMPSLSIGAAAIPYMPLHTTPTPHQVSGYDDRRRASLVSNPPTVLSSVTHDPTMTMSGHLPTIPVTAPFHSHSSFSSMTDPGFSTTTPMYASTNEFSAAHAAFKDDLARLMREYVHSSLQQGLWVPRGRAGTSSYTYVSTKTSSTGPTPTTNSADRLYAWSREVYATRRLLAGGSLNEGFRSVHTSMDELRQHLNDQDPAMLYYLLSESIAFATAAATTTDVGTAAEIRQVAATLCGHVQSLVRIVLGEAHPITRIFCRLYAKTADEEQKRLGLGPFDLGNPAHCHSKIHRKEHLEALLVPMAVLRDLLAEQDPAMVDPVVAGKCQRMAYLLHHQTGGRLVPVDGDAEAHGELADLMSSLQASRNLHTKLQFFTTYLEYLAERVVQTQQELKGQAQALAQARQTNSTTSNWHDMTMGGVVTAASNYSTSSSDLDSRLLGKQPMALQQPRTSIVTATGSMQSPLPSSATSTPSSTASPALTTMALSSGVSSAFMSRPSVAGTTAATITTPRTMAGGAIAGQSYGQQQLPTPQHHQQSQSPPQYGLHQQHQSAQHSAYPPVPQSYHHPTTTSMATGHGAALAAQTLNGSETAALTVGGGMHETGSLTWELGDVVNMDWM
ncbi:hypothetical protein SEUCBS139899_008071 [Sporothrix eucalyptigena]|uniref:Clr5 domain-containing protein n=1 Tax=Sporothrix eucalyptigena TaxID=1812306 RepID=A0ABP0CFJ6_9PEZI